MSRILSLVLVLMFTMVVLAFAEDIDLRDFTDAELDGLERAIAMEREARTSIASSTNEEVDPRLLEEETEGISEEQAEYYVPLQEGSTGEDVKEIQTALKALGYAVSSADGIYGKRTTEAVKAYQIANGFEASGIVDEKTFSAVIEDGQEANAAKEAMSRIKKNLFVDVDRSEGVILNDKLDYEFVSQNGDNTFSWARMQILDEDSNYLQDFPSTTSDGRLYEDDYYHMYESGEYLIRIKANGTKQDEFIAKMIRLDEGETYHFTYIIDTMVMDKVIIKNVGFGLKKP